MKIRYFTRGGKVWLDIRPDAGERKRVLSGCSTQAAAELAAPAIIAELFPSVPATGTIATQQAIPLRARGFTLKQAYEKTWRENSKWLTCKDKGGKQQTYNQLVATKGVTETMDCGRFTYDFVLALRSAWLTAPGMRKGTTLSNSTINHRLSLITTLLDTVRCPPHGVKHLSVKGNRRERRVRADEHDAMLTWFLANHHRKGATTMADLLLVGLSTTARIGEWLGMLWADVYFDTATVVYRDTKNGTSRPGTLCDTCMRILERRRTLGGTGPFTDLPMSQAAQLWRDGRKAIGLEDDHEFVFHVATRHEGLSRLGDAGVSVLQMKAHGGHVSTAALERYVHPGVEAQRPLHEIINPSGIRPARGTDAKTHSTDLQSDA
jgi:integrase